MNSSLHVGDQITIQTVLWSPAYKTLKCQDDLIYQEGHAHSFLGCTWHNSASRTIKKGKRSTDKNIQNIWTVLTKYWWNKDRTWILFINSAHETLWITVRIIFPCTIFFRCSPLRLFPVSKLEKWVGGKKLSHWIRRSQNVSVKNAFF